MEYVDDKCHAINCGDYNTLYCFNGYFCLKHKDEMALIRSLLQIAKESDNLDLEIKMRKTEIEIRRYIDPGHKRYLSNLLYLKKINFIT